MAQVSSNEAVTITPAQRIEQVRPIVYEFALVVGLTLKERSIVMRNEADYVKGMTDAQFIKYMSTPETIVSTNRRKWFFLCRK